MSFIPLGQKESTASSKILLGYNLLEKIAKGNKGITVTELMQQFDLTKSTAHRLIKQLEAHGLLSQHEEARKYVLGRRVLDFARSVVSNEHTIAEFYTILQRLANDLGETCNCSIFDGRHIVYYARVECRWPIRVQLQEGSQLPLHCTASGKLFLAFTKPKQRSRLLKTLQLDRYTEQSITDPIKLEENLKRIRSNGFSCDDQELIDGMVAIAVPVCSNENDMADFHYTLAVHAPTLRKDLPALLEYLPQLRAAAQQLARIQQPC